MNYRTHINDGAYENIKQLCKERNPHMTMSRCAGCRYSYRYIVKKDDPNYDGRDCCIFGDIPQSWED